MSKTQNIIFIFFLKNTNESYEIIMEKKAKK